MTDETTGQGAASNQSQNNGGIPAGPTGAPQNNSLGAPVPASPEREANGSLTGDIAKILKDVKLPERRDTQLTGERKVPTETKDIDTLLAEGPAAPQGTPPPAQEPIVEKPPAKESVPSLHTLKQDLQQVVHDQKISVVKAAALEQEKKRPPVFAPGPQSNRVKNTVVAALVLLFLGGAALGGVYVVVQGRAAPLPEQPTDSLVFAEQTVSLQLEGQTPIQLKNLLADARGSSNASLGSITRIAPVKTNSSTEEASTRLATLAEFLSAIGAAPPEELMRSLGQDFFFGLHTVDRNAPLLVIPVLSYDRAFAGMLAWESTLSADLAPIYARVPDLVLGEGGIPQKRTFTDVVMRNYDVRALTDDSGAVALYYSFPTRGLLVIAESPYTFTELLSRLQAQRKL